MPPLASMTAFGRASGENASLSWSWEARSVNGRSLDIRIRLPAGLERLEPAARSAVGARFKRGNVTCGLNVVERPGAGAFLINEALLDSILALQKSLGDRVSREPPRIETLLAIRGIVEPAGEAGDDADHASVFMDALDEALNGLAAARVEEGARLAELLRRQLNRMERLTSDAKKAAAAQVPVLQDRLRVKVTELLGAEPSLPEDRLMQELAVMTAKVDVTEELDRLAAHVDSARELLETGGAVGRRLDFLCQEFNREANTLCSKSSDLALTRIGLDLKATIEQLREQAQNLE